MQILQTRQSTELRQAAIIAAVLELTAERSPALITTNDIALTMGLSQGAIFKHFPTKEAIWLAVMEWTQEQLLTALESAALEGTTALERLQAVFMTHVHFVMEYPGVPRLIFNELQQPDDTPLKQHVRKLLQGYRKILARLLAAAEDAGELAEELNQDAAATLFIGTVQGLVMQSMLAGSTKRMDAAARPVFRLYLQAIRRTS